MTTILVLTLILFITTAYAAQAAGPKLTTRIAQTQVGLWKCQDQLAHPRTRPSVAPWQLPKPTAYRQWVLSTWTHRKTVCLKALHEQARQWNWRAWLPRNWYRVGSCETGYGQDPNWAHGNSSYVSAFGIQRGSFAGAYDHDAAKVGMPPWSDDPRRRPTPWQQYQTALSHYRSYGDGWGCPGP